jgi:O-antigen/teichoic acid export membrane protein
MLRRNLIANYLGQGWVALMGIAFLPLYIKYLGIEAFGLIGLFAVLTAALAVLDLGMKPTLGREMARFTGGHHDTQSIRDILRSIEWIGIGIAILITSAIALGSNWLAGGWLQIDELPLSTVSQALAVMGLVIALRFVEGIYRSSIIGLQRQVSYNVVNSTMATLRAGGAVLVLAWVSPTIEAFFYWQALMSLTSLGALGWLTYAAIPGDGRVGSFSISALRGIWRFAGGIFAITVLGMLLTQIDKILVSKLLSLSDFGFYALAAMVAGALYMIVGPITQAWYPRLCELHARDDVEAISKAYHNAAQLVSVVAGSAAIVLIVFSESILLVWTRDADLAEGVAPILSLLVAAHLFNSLTHVPYYIQLAHGWTSLILRFGLVALAVYAPVIIWVTPRYGAEGAALSLVFLNLGYMVVVVHFMHRRILRKEEMNWVLYDVLRPLGAAFLVALAIKLAWGGGGSTVETLGWLFLASAASIGAAAVASKVVRGEMGRIFATYRARFAI